MTEQIIGIDIEPVHCPIDLDIERADVIVRQYWSSNYCIVVVSIVIVSRQVVGGPNCLLPHLPFRVLRIVIVVLLIVDIVVNCYCWNPRPVPSWC